MSPNGPQPTIQDLDDRFGFTHSIDLMSATPQALQAKRARFLGVRAMSYVLLKSSGAVVTQTTRYGSFHPAVSLIVPHGSNSLTDLVGRPITQNEWTVMQPNQTVVWQACCIEHIVCSEDDPVTWFRHLKDGVSSWWSFELTDTQQKWQACYLQTRAGSRTGSVFRPNKTYDKFPGASPGQ